MEFKPVYPKEVMDYKNQADEYRDWMIESLKLNWESGISTRTIPEARFAEARAYLLEKIAELYQPLLMYQMLNCYYEVTGLSEQEKINLISIIPKKRENEH